MRNKLIRFAVIVMTFIMMMTSFSFSFADSMSSPNAVPIKNAKITVLKKSSTYDGSRATVPIKVQIMKDGVLVDLVEGVDYIISGNETAGAKAKAYTVKYAIVGIGHYKGFVSKSVVYTIKKAKQTISISAIPVEGTAATFTVPAEEVKAGGYILDLGLIKNTNNKYIWSLTGKITASTSDGVIKLPKTLKKGTTYTLKVYVAGTANYNKSAVKTIKIKVV